jgi:hypothetical protein
VRLAWGRRDNGRGEQRRSYQIPKTTLKPLFLAAGMMFWGVSHSVPE